MRLYFPALPVLSIALAVFPTLQTSAVTYTYSRTVSNDSLTADQWSVGTNWTAVPVSASDTTLAFSGTLAAGRTIFANNDIGNFQLNALNFTYAGPASGTAPTVTLSGSPLEFVLNGATAPVLTVNPSGAVRPTLTISNNILFGTNTAAPTGTGTLTLSGTLSGTGNLALSTAGGTTIITNDNSGTYSGQIQVNRNTLAIGNDGALGSGSVRHGISDATSVIRSTDTTTRNISNLVTFNGTASGANTVYRYGSATASQNGNLNFTGTTNVSLGTNSVRKFEVHNRTQFDAALTASGGGITMQTGVGTLVLNGANTYTGATTVNAGTLQINGNSSAATGAVTVGANGTLGGDGTIGGATTVNGKLAPGNSPGDLAFTSSLTLTATAESIFEINGTTEGTLYDAVDVTGALTYDGILTLDFGFTPTNGQTFNLFDFGSQGGAFDSINILDPVSGTFDPSTGIFTVVPEPTSATLMGASLVAMMVFRRRR